MWSNLLKSKKLAFGATLVAAAAFVGCTLEPYIISSEELYTRNFIKDFGLIDPNQDWNLAKEATVTVNLGDALHKSVKIYAKNQGKYYLVADLTDISGRLDVPVDVPKSTTDIMVVTNGRKYYGGLASPIDCSDMSRGIPNSTYDADGTNPNPDVYTKTEGAYTVSVKHTTSGNAEGTVYEKYNDKGAYQYFNTQQISPLISTTVWDTYYSANTKKWTANPGNWIGLLPESGVFNRPKNELEDWISKKKYDEGQSIVEDFRITTGDNGNFTLFPYYYGTNLKHELGVYLLDDDGNPLLKNGGTYSSSKTDYTLDDFISFPVFQDRQPGDLQVQPHYDSAITGIRIMNGDSEINGDNPIEFELDANFDLQEKVQIERGSEGWMSYADYIKNYGSQYHSRVAYHFWVDEPDDNTKERPDSFARIYNNGIVTPLKITKNHNDEGIAYANVAIQTGLEKSDLGAGIGRIQGVESNFTYKVINGSKIKSIEIAESDLKLCVGETKTLTVTLKDKNGGTLPLADYWNEISVTDGWDTDKCQISKDDGTKTIKLEAKGWGECWPRVYVTETNWDGTSDYVHVLTAPHHITEEYTGESDAIDLTTWRKYFKENDIEDKNILDKILDGNPAMGAWGGVHVSKDAFSDISEDCSILFELSKADNVYLAYDWNDDKFQNQYTYIVDGVEKKSSDFRVDKTVSKFELPVQSWMIDGLKNIGLLIHAGENGCQVTSLVIKNNSEYTWISTGKKDVADFLASQYEGKAGTTCDYCHSTFDFSGCTPEVEIMDDANYNNIHYTVTWEPRTGTYSVSKHKPSTRANKASRLSREYDPTAKHLEAGDASDWKDVNSFWSRLLPHQEEVASYPPNICMLARSRGYDVTITYGKDENGNPKPWVGNLGMYLKVVGSYDILSKKDDNGNTIYPEQFYDNYTAYTKNNTDKSKEEYVVFSQKRFNKAANGATDSDQISALSVKHPMSGRTFLTFEDMRVTHPGVTPADFKEKSSDRDVNDLIFVIANYGSISNGKDEISEKTNDETISWLWAVEDLGSTDDFDFNDMVMKITSVTKNKTTTTDKTDENGNTTTTTTTTKLYKKVTFEPLCAGGTLPLYVQFAKGGKTYILKPGVFKEDGLDYKDDEAAPLSSLAIDVKSEGYSDGDKYEIHSWFGDYPVTKMINTNGSEKIKAKTCVIYLEDFKIEGFGSESQSVGSESQSVSQVGPRGGLSVYVKDERGEDYNDQNSSAIYDSEGGWTISKPEEGKVSQMFMIYDADTKWYWPQERTHILTAYPGFKDWVNSKDTYAKWYENVNKKETCPRHDLK